MKKTLFIIWLAISSILVLVSGIELCYGISLWIKEQNIPFWGPASITQSIVFLVGILSLALSIIFLVKYKEENKGNK